MRGKHAHITISIDLRKCMKAHLVAYFSTRYLSVIFLPNLRIRIRPAGRETMQNIRLEVSV